MDKRHKQSEPSRRTLIRWPRLLEIIPLGETMIREQLIATGKLRPVPLGPRAVGFVENEVFQIADELIAARDAALSPDEAPAAARKPSSENMKADPARRRTRSADLSVSNPGKGEHHRHEQSKAPAD